MKLTQMLKYVNVLLLDTKNSKKGKRKMMKKNTRNLKYLLCMLASIALVGCSNAGEDLDIGTESISTSTESHDVENVDETAETAENAKAGDASADGSTTDASAAATETSTAGSFSGDLASYGLDTAKLAKEGIKVEKEIAPYGVVLSAEKEYACPFCGTVLESHISEAFQLDSKYSEHALKINEELRGKMSEGLKYEGIIGGQSQEDAYDGIAPSLPADDSECDYHKEEVEGNPGAGSTFCDEVHIIDNRYLLIDTSYYYYTGGVHGMSSADQIIYDLSTGESLKAQNFTKCTEEELKALVAEKVKEEYAKRPDDFFAKSADEAYKDAYEIVSFDSSNIFFYDDKVTYRFNPYDIGPYGATFVDIDFSYKDFSGTDALTRIK